MPLSCLYLKIYQPRKQDDAFLSGFLLPLLQSRLYLDHFERCFFIRYSDPRDHLRIRFFGSRSSVMGSPRKAILRLLEEHAQTNGHEFQCIVARYRPERHRYGGREGVEFAERLFDISSSAVLSYLASRDEASVSDIEFALVTAESMMDAIGLSLEDRNQAYHASIDATPEIEDALESVASAFGSRLERIVQNPREFWAGHAILEPIVERIYASLKPIATNRFSDKTVFGVPKQRLSSAYLHMHLNRIAIFRYKEMILRCLRSRVTITK